MARTKNPSYLQQRGHVWYAALDIPKPLRKHFDDRPRFLKSLGTESHAEAERLKLTVIAGWKAELAAAKSGRPDAFKDLEQSALDWAIAYKSSDIEVREIAELEVNAIAHDLAWKDEEIATSFHMIATNRSFPLNRKIEEWLSTRDDAPKTTHMKRADLKRFSERFKYSHNVTAKSVRTWVHELEHQQSYKQATIQRILSPCRGYWDYLERAGYIVDAGDPWTSALRREKRKTKQSEKSGWIAFEVDDVVCLLRSAEERGDRQLAQLIWLAMWTGCRIEEICSLRCSDVTSDLFKVREAKSAAGNREVPIHRELSRLMTYLTNTSADGFVLADLTLNKFGNRSNSLGKRFGRLKASLGFSDRHVFHSIRKTVATQLENALVPESVSADILGHEKPTMTYGVYSGGTNMTVRREAIEKLSYPISGTPRFLLQAKP